MKWIAWDIEIAKDMTGIKDWNAERPLGITCAATLSSEGKVKLYHGPLGDMYAPQMTPAECQAMLDDLVFSAWRGYFVCTWNGVSFDWRTLAEECGLEEHGKRCALSAMGHVDVGFQMVCEKGYMIGLDKAAKGLGVKGKTEGVSGAQAPAMWAESREQQEECLEYVEQDVRATGNVIEALLKGGKITWYSQKGNRQSWRPKVTFDGGGELRLMTAQECLDKLTRPPRAFHTPDEYMGWMTPWR